MDHGDILASGMSLAKCSGRDDGRMVDNNVHYSMVQWRTAVRYVTQYKVDIAGTPRDFILRVSSFSSYTMPQREGGGRKVFFGTPSGDEMISETLLYLNQWGSIGEELHRDTGHHGYSDHQGDDDDHHPYLDKEWKHLSGGESQRTLLAIAMASRPMVLLLDEATSGLDAKTEKCVEKSIVEYAKKYQAAILWVTHSEDITERLLSK